MVACPSSYQDGCNSATIACSICFGPWLRSLCRRDIVGHPTYRHREAALLFRILEAELRHPRPATGFPTWFPPAWFAAASVLCYARRSRTRACPVRVLFERRERGPLAWLRAR